MAGAPPAVTRERYLERFGKEDWWCHRVDIEKVKTAYDELVAAGEEILPHFVVLQSNRLRNSVTVWLIDIDGEDDLAYPEEPWDIEQWVDQGPEDRVEDLMRWWPDKYPCTDQLCESDCEYCRAKQGRWPGDDRAEIEEKLRETEEIVRRMYSDGDTTPCILRSTRDMGWETERDRRRRIPRDPVNPSKWADVPMFRHSIEFLVPRGVMLVYSAESDDVRPHRTEDDPVFEFKPWRPERDSAALFLRYVRAASAPGDDWDRATIPYGGDTEMMSNTDWELLERIYLSWRADRVIPPPPPEWEGGSAFEGYKAAELASLLRELE